MTKILFQKMSWQQILPGRKKWRRKKVSLKKYFLLTNSEKLQERITSAQSTQGRKPRTKPLGPVLKVTVCKANSPALPYFPKEFELVYYQTLQWTDVKENHNKYYVLEFHKAEEKGKGYYRLCSHYGRTDDLATNPNAGQRECRDYPSETKAEDAFAAIIDEKTVKKGYAIVDLLFSNIGSQALKKLGQALSPASDPVSGSSEAQTVPSSLDPKVWPTLFSIGS